MTDFSVAMIDLDGNKVMTGDRPMTLGRVVAEALLVSGEADRNVGGEEKLRRFNLAQKVAGGGEVSLPVEDLAYIKQRIGVVCTAWTVGQAWKILDPAGA